MTFSIKKVNLIIFSLLEGVAAGLRASPKAKGIDSTWIMFNKPKERDNPNLIVSGI